MYGFASHGMLTPHTSIRQMWWTEERIKRYVTPAWIAQQIRPVERNSLLRSINSDMTTLTCVEWIMQRSPRLFLVLVHINCADKIFQLVDDLWEDDDLPIARMDIKRIELSVVRDEKLNRRFFDAQFTYILRQPKKGDHLEYGLNEQIAMDYANTIPAAVPIQSWPRVQFPLQGRKVFVRRKFDLGEDRLVHRLQFLQDVDSTRRVRHEHIAPVWSSYTMGDAGYTLTDFVGEHTLRTFMDHRTSPQYMRLQHEERQCLLLEWMHCLADTITYMHYKGVAHGNIRPSNILIDAENCIAFADLGNLKTFSRDKHLDKQESREYAPPEAHAPPAPNPRLASQLRLQKQASSSDLSMLPSPRLRQMPSGSLASLRTASAAPAMSGSTLSEPGPSSPRSRNFSRPTLTLLEDRSPSMARLYELPTPPATPMTPMSTTSHDYRSILGRVNSSSTRVKHDKAVVDMEASFPSPPTRMPTPPHLAVPASPSVVSTRTTYSSMIRAAIAPKATPQQGDVFALGCVFLDVLTFLLQGRVTDFQKFRRKLRVPASSAVGGSSRPGSPIVGDATSISAASTTSRRTAMTVLTALTHSTLTPDKALAAAESFFSDPLRVDAWLARLRLSAFRADPSTDLLAATGQLSALIRRMLCPEPCSRPSARDVRDSLAAILGATCGMTGLCCADREWDPDAAAEAQLGWQVAGKGLKEALGACKDELKRREKERFYAATGGVKASSAASVSGGSGAEGVPSGLGLVYELPAETFSSDSAEGSAVEVGCAVGPGRRGGIVSWRMVPFFARLRKKGPFLKMP